jgi:hypothetical protein
MVIQEIVGVRSEKAELAYTRTLGRVFLAVKQPVVFATWTLCHRGQGQFSALERPGVTVTCPKCARLDAKLPEPKKHKSIKL